MIAPSDRAVRALDALGGTAPLEHVRAHLDWLYGPAGTELGIDLAVTFGRVERLALPDGRAGLKLVDARREAPA